MSQERRDLLDDVCTILTSLHEVVNENNSATVSTSTIIQPAAVAILLAEALESRGNYSGALGMLSGLMDADKSSCVDPSYVIFRSAGTKEVLLRLNYIFSVITCELYYSYTTSRW